MKANYKKLIFNQDSKMYNHMQIQRINNKIGRGFL